MTIRLRIAPIGLTVPVIVLSACGQPRWAPAPPAQPTSGPGGKSYPHGAVTKSLHGRGGRQYWLYEPASPTPASAPLVVFCHGWTATNPNAYGAWIEHIVRRGNIVVYPRYQSNAFTPMRELLPNAVAAVKNGIGILQTAGHVKPDLDQFAIVGHSVGGALTANLAVAAGAGLPRTKAIMCVEPAGRTGPLSPGPPMEDMTKIPDDTLLLVIVGDWDDWVGDKTAKWIFSRASQVPDANKDYVILVSDSHGRPSLTADHIAPLAFNRSYAQAWDLDFRPLLPSAGGARGINALDFYGLWKLFDGLTDAAFYGRNREYALGNTPQQRFMGLWSDGTPVKELIVTHRP
jgi:pimeloyl-ACP methyl ester carboxylesterase